MAATPCWPGPQTDCTLWRLPEAVLAARWGKVLKGARRAIRQNLDTWTSFKPPPESARPMTVVWEAFPRTRVRQGESAAEDWRFWELQTSSTWVYDRHHDEYCEWGWSEWNGRKALIFTTEFREYVEVCAQGNKGGLDAYYADVPTFSSARDATDTRGLISKSPLTVPRHGQFPQGVYNPLNRWNTGPQGAVKHLTWPESSVNAAVALLVFAGARHATDRPANAQPTAIASPERYCPAEVEDAMEGACRGPSMGLVNPNRSSDVAILGAVQAAHRAGLRVHVPANLGIGVLPPHTATWRWRDGPLSPGDLSWDCIRAFDGCSGRPIVTRAALTLRAARPWSDLYIDGMPLTGASQIAHCIGVEMPVWVAPNPRDVTPEMRGARERRWTSSSRWPERLDPR